MSKDESNGRRIIFTNQFAEQLDEVASKNTYEKIKRRILTLGTFPAIGSPNPRSSLVERFGPDIRISPADRFVIVYRNVNEGIEFLALVYGSSVV